LSNIPSLTLTAQSLRFLATILQRRHGDNMTRQIANNMYNIADVILKQEETYRLMRAEIDEVNASAAYEARVAESVKAVLALPPLYRGDAL